MWVGNCMVCSDRGYCICKKLHRCNHLEPYFRFLAGILRPACHQHDPWLFSSLTTDHGYGCFRYCRIVCSCFSKYNYYFHFFAGMGKYVHRDWNFLHWDWSYRSFSYQGAKEAKVHICLKGLSLRAERRDRRHALRIQKDFTSTLHLLELGRQLFQICR